MERYISEKEIYTKTLERQRNKKKLLANTFKWSSGSISYAVLIFWALICLFPFIWTMFSSFKNPYLISLQGINPFPKEWTTVNYTSIFQNDTLSEFATTWITNSVTYSVITAVLNATFNIMGGFALAKIAMKGKGIVIYYFIVSILVPSQATFFPSFFILSKMGIISVDISSTAFLLAVVFSGMANIVLTFMARQFFLTQTSEMEEAAKMDGCSMLLVFVKITLRRMLPLFATQFVLVFMGSWNNFLTFQLYALGDFHKMTLNSGVYALAKSSIDKAVGYGQTLAISNISFIPMFAIYLVSLKIQLRGIKGGNK